MLRVAARMPIFPPAAGRLKINGIVATSAINMSKKNASQKADTSDLGRVSNPMGGGNSKTVRIRIATTAPRTALLRKKQTTPRLAWSFAIRLVASLFHDSVWSEDDQKSRRRPARLGQSPDRR